MDHHAERSTRQISIPEPLNLTIGVEFESLIQYNWTTHMSSDEGHATIFQHLASHLASAGLPVNPSMPAGEIDDHTGWSLDYDFTIDSTEKHTLECGGRPTPYLPASAEEVKYIDYPRCRPHPLDSLWKADEKATTTLDPYSSHIHPGESKHVTHPLELKSPILFSSSNWESQIRLALGALHAAFPENQLWTNNSCGLHIHIGPGPHPRSFPLRTLKNIGIICYAWERMIDVLHPPCRVNGTKWCQSLNENEWATGLGVTGFAETVEREQDHVEVLCWLGITKKRSVKFGECDCWGSWPPKDEDHLMPYKRTVEFRQHIGTVEADAVVNWIKFVVALVEFAHGLPEGRAVEMVREESVGMGPRDVFEIMELIGVPELMGYYWERKRWEHSYVTSLFQCTPGFMAANSVLDEDDEADDGMEPASNEALK